VLGNLDANFLQGASSPGTNQGTQNLPTGIGSSVTADLVNVGGVVPNNQSTNQGGVTKPDENNYGGSTSLNPDQKPSHPLLPPHHW